MKYTVRPISDRTAFTGQHEASRFTVTYSDVLDLLGRELDHLDAENVVVEVDVEERQIRLDGLLRSDAKAKSPGVRLAFDSNVGPLAYATDAFVRGPSWAYVGTGANRRRRDTMAHPWQHNLYAIAKGLEALRMVDRYGVTKRGEQYTGFKAIGAGTAMPASHMTRTEAAELLERIAIGNEGPLRDRTVRDILDDPAVAFEVRRAARKIAHPDRRGGDHTLWNQVEQAARVLGVAR
ncbi:hypothetical protein GUY44_06980 [Pimelobacter simplex]|uniref:Heat shock DnaJ-like protein n=1 Tax=Nocardioides simplex TaxID=2045 RepID=A0A0A1DK74_NOCSI|nr:hypothetical protein [Pimelobacter simplex]AIY17754.1 heat shock DnaJ-like protein [Pimelobacter simplex]MCG8150215.1 hypothetical protein [Pimelobacter simplex]GEB13575.1 hypothetical protein NSI01_18900 [Pimelobacter simplex]SFM71493.1 hypothetical protein SAMN05421671_3096 [Pimelobacter simplex]